ncbi:signal peptidase II [candidate division KSB1 bacterium]|nr:signal peptidase II [candidate division KSB1 bacterium]
MIKEAKYLLLWVALLAFLDQAVRTWIHTILRPGETITLLGNFARLHFQPNYTGFSYFVPPMPDWVHWIYNMVLVFIALAALPVYLFHTGTRHKSRAADVAFVCLLAAVLGHLLEGLFVPYTTDFIQIYNSPCANLADVYAYIGLAALVLEAILYLRLKKKKRNPPTSKEWLPLAIWRYLVRSWRDDRSNRSNP